MFAQASLTKRPGNLQQRVINSYNVLYKVSMRIPVENNFTRSLVNETPREFANEEILDLCVFSPQATLRRVRLEPNVDGHLAEDISGTKL